jgi:3-phosphoshikimate 1-carboxyvinyltransferase
MAEAIAALGAREEVIIDDDGAVAVTFPNFFSLLDSIRKV